MYEDEPGHDESVMETSMELLGYVAGASRAPLQNLDTNERNRLAEILRVLQVPTREDRGV